jgi:hypothetical protein
MARTKQDARKSTGAGPLRKVNKPARPAKPILLKPQDGTCLLCEAPGVVFDDLAGGVLCTVHEQERRDTSPEDSAEAIAARRKADAARAKALAAAVEAERLAAKRAAHEALLARAAAESSESEDASQPRDDVHALTRKTLRLQYALSAAPSESVMEVLRAAVSGGDTAVVDALSKVLPKARFPPKVRPACGGLATALCSALFAASAHSRRRRPSARAATRCSIRRMPSPTSASPSTWSTGCAHSRSTPGATR